MELKEAIDKLFEMTDEQRYESFGLEGARAVLDNYYMDTLIKNIEEFYSEPKYGDMYMRNFGDSNKKCIFLSEDNDCDKYWLLFNSTDAPQGYSKSSFKRNYTKTGKNVADKLNGLFE